MAEPKITIIDRREALRLLDSDPDSMADRVLHQMEKVGIVNAVVVRPKLEGEQE